MKILERPFNALLYDKCVLSISVSRSDWREINDLINEIEPIDKQADYLIKIAKKRKKRSLDANAYAWVLIGKLAEKLRESTITVYRQIIADMSVFQIVPIRIDAIDKWIDIWTHKGLGWICEDMGECRNFPDYHNMKSHYGSSAFDTKEMSHFIDLIIQECKEQNIETLTPNEVRKLKETWGAGNG